MNAAASIVAYVGGSSDVERIRQAYEEARTPQEETRYLYALAHTRTPESVEAVLGFYLSDAVKIQDSAYALGELLENRYARGKAWEAVETHWATFLKKYPRPMLQAFYSPIGQVVEANLADRMMAFVDAHPIPEIARQTEQAKEFQGIHRAFHERISTAVREALEAHMP